jgi:branched-chain amino acid transport system permease protein
MLYFAQQVLNGLHSSALYAMLAFGYTLIHGVTRRTNIAHGAVFAFAGQVMIVAGVFGWQVLWLTLPATLAFGAALSFAYVGLVSAILARHVFAPLADRSPNTLVAATLGVSLVLMELGRIASDTRDFWLPPMLAVPVVFMRHAGFEATLTVIQLIDIGIVVSAIAAGALFLEKSAFGRSWRAIADDPFAARMCGVDVGRVFFLTVLAGGLAAALAGNLAALYFGNISFGTGLVFGLKILFLTAAGGYRSPLASALGAAAFGMGESLWSGYFPILWRDAAMFSFLVALLVLRAAPPSDDIRTPRPG